MADFSNTATTIDSRFESIEGDSDEDELDLQFIVVGKKCRNNQELNSAMQDIDAEVIYSDTGLEYVNKADDNTVFILDNFEGDIFQRLNRDCCRILAPPVVIKCAKDGKRLPYNQRPLYCLLMHKLVLCFTGFKQRDELARLAELVRHMGGSIRRDVTASVTHLVSKTTSGEKYRAAVSMGIPIMTENWVLKCWESRLDLTKCAQEEQFVLENKMSPFQNLVLSFHGFTKEEETDMEKIAVENGAYIAQAGAPSCSHVVIDDQTVKQLDFDVHHRQHVVKSEWFWASVQMDACADESFYRFDYDHKNTCTPDSPRSYRDAQKTMSGSKSRKRKRLRENLAQLASEGEIDTPMYKRRSSDMALVSCGASFLDVTPDVSGHILHEQTVNKTPTSPPLAPPSKEIKLTARQLVIRELFSTEKNYVGILHTILKVFKEEIEDKNQPGGPLLDVTDIKMIFGNIPPIYDVHMKIRDELNEIVLMPESDPCIGDLILKHADALLKCYPPFVNYFESTKETILSCDKEKPRFHAFLKVCMSRPECGRQSLTELLIRPVQRLPSVMLLLKDILKKTDECNPDHSKLKQALNTLDNIMQHINEDRRRAEGHQYLFEIINDIENCPADLLSSSRTFAGKADCLLVEGGIGNRGDNVTLFIFSDSLEICKRRVKVLSSRSPGQAMVGAVTPQKAYKHVSVLTLSHIKRVVNVRESGECRHVFALITKQGDEQERMLAFSIVDDQSKDGFLTLLCRTIANAICRANHETLKATVDGRQLNLDTSDLGGKTLGKAAARFSKRVSRAFSFNKTPRRLRRAISSMTQMSPFTRRDSTQSLYTLDAPPSTSSNLARNRLASYNDLTELDEVSIASSMGPSLTSTLMRDDSDSRHKDRGTENATPVTSSIYATPMSSRKCQTLSSTAKHRL